MAISRMTALTHRPVPISSVARSPIRSPLIRNASHLPQRRACLGCRGIRTLQDEKMSCAHLVIRGVARQRRQLERHLRLSEQRRAEGHRDQHDERSAHERALGHGHPCLPLDDRPFELARRGVRVRAAELLDGRRGSRPEVLERPERKVLRHVLRIGPEQPEHGGGLEDGLVVGQARFVLNPRLILAHRRNAHPPARST